MKEVRVIYYDGIEHTFKCEYHEHVYNFLYLQFPDKVEAINLSKVELIVFKTIPPEVELDDIIE